MISSFRNLFLTCSILVVPFVYLSANSAREEIRPSVLKGTWYAGSRDTLQKQVDDLLSQVPDPKTNPNRIRAVIAPHAGYTWSGACAAHSYKPLKGAGYKRIVVLAPSHHTFYQGGSIAKVDAYETPLGKIMLDRVACDTLMKSQYFSDRPEAHSQEHSIEIQLPFLQRVLGDFTLVPIVISELTSGECIGIADAIRPLLDRDTLLVISSDFTHQGPRFQYVPFKDRVKENIQRLDFVAVNFILNLNVRGFGDFLEKTKATICGRNPIKIGMMALPMQTQVEFVRYETSGDKTKDYSETVSYCSMLFRERTDYLDENETKALLQSARATLTETFKQKKPTESMIPEDRLTARLQQPKGVFVTLNKKDSLRGCIGHLESDQPLFKAVPNTVLLSAFSDRRFEPLEEKELNEIDIEISVMSPMKTIDSWKEIVLGRDGIVVEKNGRRALYLPQVALEQGWNIEDTLSHLCEKASLNANDWKSGCSFQTFTAQVFGETFREMKGI